MMTEDQTKKLEIELLEAEIDVIMARIRKSTNPFVRDRLYTDADFIAGRLVVLKEMWVEPD